MMGDIKIEEKGEIIGFEGKRVIEKKIREKIKEGLKR